MHRLIVAALAAGLALSGCKSREEILRAAEEKAKLAAEEKARAAKGIGDALSGAGQQASEALGKGVGDVLKGAERGVESSARLDVRVAAELSQLGVKVERAVRGADAPADSREAADAQAHVLQLYVVYDRPVRKRPLELRAFDAGGRELGRARAELDDAAAGARYLDFPFDARAPLSVVHHAELVSR